MRFRVDIRRKEGLSDPEGLATHRALRDLGYDSVDDVHFGRSIYLDVAAEDSAAAEADVDAMCQKLLANPVMEEYTITLLAAVESTWLWSISARLSPMAQGTSPSTRRP